MIKRFNFHSTDRTRYQISGWGALTYALILGVGAVLLTLVELEKMHHTNGR